MCAQSPPWVPRITPMMIKACIKMLHALGVKNEQIAFDEL